MTKKEDNFTDPPDRREDKRPISISPEEPLFPDPYAEWLEALSIQGPRSDEEPVSGLLLL